MNLALDVVMEAFYRRAAPGLSLVIIGGLLLLVGFKARYAAILLFLFTVAATFLGHQFWVDPSQQTQFLKNLVIMGALLMLAVHGAGPYSVDDRSGPR